MKTKINGILLAYVVITIIYIFFSHFAIFSNRININTGYLVISIAFLIYMLITKYERISLDKCDYWLILFIFYLFALTLEKNLNFEGKKYVVFFTTISLITCIIKNFDKWSKIIIKIMLFCALIHCIFIILHAMSPTVILKIDKYLLKSGTWEVVNRGTNNNYYSGITAGPASAGLFATILIGIVACKIIEERKINFKNIIFLLIGITALFLSQKRAFLLATVMSLVIVIYVVSRMQKKITKLIKNIFIFGIVSIILLQIISLIPQTRNIINRFIDNDRMLSGRETMYEEMITWFKENMYFGIGPGTAQEEFGYGGHNIYLQMFAECGIIGASIYFIYLLNLCATNMKIATKGKNIDYRILFSIFMQTVLLIYGMTGNPIYDYSYLVVFMYILTIPRGLKKELNNIEDDKCNNSSL